MKRFPITLPLDTHDRRLLRVLALRRRTTRVDVLRQALRFFALAADHEPSNLGGFSVNASQPAAKVESPRKEV